MRQAELTGAMPETVVRGAIRFCQGCGADALRAVLDLGHQPPCDSLVRPERLGEPEIAFPLVFCRCGSCGLAQINYAVEPEVVFFPEYPYQTSMTASLRAHFRRLTDEIAVRLRLGAEDLAVDIGSNDGTLLKGFQEAGVRVLGIEPTNVAQIANANGVPTVQTFFDEVAADTVLAEHGPAAVVTGTNMFAHIDNLYPALEAIAKLLRPDGVFVSESHYLLNLLDELQYDTIYHEHLRFYSLRPLIGVLERAGLSVFDVERVETHGGSIRVWADFGKQDVSPRVAELLELEDERGIYGEPAYETFRERVVGSKHALLRLLLAARERGPIVGVGAPGRASTILNYVGIQPDLVGSITELTGSLKIGQLTPGTHVPIVDEQVFFDDPPPTALILAWHIAEPVVSRLRARGYRGDLLLPLPEPRILSG